MAYSTELETAIAAARAAGRRQLDGLGTTHDVRVKTAVFDLVTEVDGDCERIVRDALLARFPQDAFLGEEDGAVDGTSGRTWIVDPLDGTLNYAHGFPFFAVSIALSVDDEVVVGVVHDPVRDEVFSAVRGAGACLDGRPIRVSNRAPLESALLGTGFAYRSRTEGTNIPLFVAALERCRGVRRAGAAALDLAYTAAGRLDGFWEISLAPWDTAAGTLLVEEAGGSVTGGRGDPHRPGDPAVVAAGPSLHADLLGLLQGAGLLDALPQPDGPG